MVHAETLRFKKEGVFAVVKDVFLPWYNAYRFLVQNVLRLEADCGERFYPSEVTHTPAVCPARALASCCQVSLFARPCWLYSLLLGPKLAYAGPCMRAPACW